MLFAWDDSNIEHIAKHGVTPTEAEHVVSHARDPWPAQKGDDRLVVWGGTDVGRLLQVIFVLRHADEVEFESLTIDEWADLNDDDEVIYVVHAMDLTPGMKKLYRKRRRSDR